MHGETIGILMGCQVEDDYAALWKRINFGIPEENIISCRIMESLPFITTKTR